MTDFATYTLETVPEKGRETLETVNQAYGFVPHLLGTMVEAPALAQAYLDIGKNFAATSLNETERQVVLLTTSRINECGYCMAAHTAIAGLNKVPAAVIDALRDDKPIEDDRLEALRQLTVAVVEKRGWLVPSDIEAFIAAGWERQQVLEVVLGVAMKTLSNYTNHIADTPLDEPFRAAEWQPASARVA